MSDRRDFLKQFALGTALLTTRSWSITATEVNASLPGEYYRRLVRWCGVVQAKLKELPDASIKQIEAEKGWYHFPYTVLSAAVLYAKKHPDNHHYQSQEMLNLTREIGDILIREDKAGTFAPRLDSYRDTYMWIEAYGLIQEILDDQRKQKWQAALERNIALLVPELMAWEHLPAYTENFIGTSPNHFAWWAATVLVGGVHLQKKTWFDLGCRILKRFATTEQNPDGYWGEHNPNGPTGGYNYLTTLAVGVYWEHTKDTAAIKALRRATDFHVNFTYPDGNLMELFNDRNRYWHISPWGQFAFSHFPDGRGYAQLLTDHIDNDKVDLDSLGLLAQNALYYHDGVVAVPVPLLPAYVHRLHGSEAGARKRGPWVHSLSGIIDTPLPRSQWFLDRQANISLFHTQVGLILSGANSKHQPELATFSEKIAGEWFMKPKGSRLTQSEKEDVLAVAHNSFSAEITVPASSALECAVNVRIAGRGPAPQEAWFALQLCLESGKELVTGSGQHITLSSDRIQLSAEDLKGAIRHKGWVLEFDADATLQWPYFPYNPYINGNETKLEHAIGLLRTPLKLKTGKEHWLQPDELTIQMKAKVQQ